MTNKLFRLGIWTLAASMALPSLLYAGEWTDCYESRGFINEDGDVEGYSVTEVEQIRSPFYDFELPNVKCSDRTAGVLWWGDPFYGTIKMGDMPVEADYSHEEAVVKPREDQLTYWPCGSCHDGESVPYPKNKNPRLIEMHQDIVPNSLKLPHGKGAIWCLDCHSMRNRERLIDHRGNEIRFNDPQKLCGKCHGQIFRDWREGIHGKRIGMWTPGGKKRWWVCTECHNPHDVQQGNRMRGFAQLYAEPAPELPKGMKNADHEKVHHGHGGGHEDSSSAGAASDHSTGHGTDHSTTKKQSSDGGSMWDNYNVIQPGEQEKAAKEEQLRKKDEEIKRLKEELDSKRRVEQ